MQNEFTPPSKDDIRRKYGITNEDFEVLVQPAPTPPDRLFSIDAYLQPVASFFGVPTFLFKRGLCVLAVILVPYWGPPAKRKVEECYHATSDFWLSAFGHLPQPSDFESARYVAVVPNSVPLSSNVSAAMTGAFAAGTSIFFISRSAPPPDLWT